MLYIPLKVDILNILQEFPLNVFQIFQCKNYVIKSSASLHFLNLDIRPSIIKLYRKELFRNLFSELPYSVLDLKCKMRLCFKSELIKTKLINSHLQ